MSVYSADILLNWGLNLTKGNPDYNGIDRKSDIQSLLTERVNPTEVSC